MEIAKALILAGPAPNDEPWPSVRSGPKPLVPVANCPILFHHLESLRRAGLLEATIALDDEGADPIVAAVGDGSRWGLMVNYVRWPASSGLRGALAAAEGVIADEPVLVEPADVLHREHIHPHIAAFASERLDAMALRVAGAPRDRGGHPVAGYLLSERAVGMLLEMPGDVADPMAGVRERGGHVRTQSIDGCLACHGGQDRLLEGNRRMLESLRRDVDADAYPTCEFQGAVYVHPTATIEHALIRGPAIIGAGTTLSHAYVGPYSSIGADVRIEGSQIEHSIVLDRAEIMNVGNRLDNSVIGAGARVHRVFGLTGTMWLSVGDGAEVTLS
jgi:glucose-1-phosphate thymidylyltransferase